VGAGLNFADTGAAHTWDYSQLSPQMQNFEQYRRAASVNFAYALFGLDAIGLKVQDSLGIGTFKMKNIYDFYKSSNSAFTAEGRGLEYNGIPVPSWYSDKDEIYQFPLNYGDRDSSTFDVKFDLAGTITFTQKGYRINEVEGWGTLITPFATYANCLKVKTKIFRRDSIKVNALPFPIALNNNLIEYKWFAQGIKGPVMIVNATVAPGGAVTVTSVKYRDEKRELLGFTVDKFKGDTIEIFSFTDTSTVSALLRQWTFTPNTVVFQNGTNALSANPVVRFTAPGTYDVALSITTTSGTDQVLRTEYITVELPKTEPPTPSAIQNFADSKWKVYPNPFKEFVKVGGLNITAISIIDTKGKCIETVVGDIWENRLNLPSGLYFIKAVSGNRDSRYFKVFLAE
jgi:hypothetical protein